MSNQAKKEVTKAAGLLAHNNESGMLYMRLDEYDLPSAFISQVDGKYLLPLDENARTLTVSSSYGNSDKERIKHTTVSRRIRVCGTTLKLRKAVCFLLRETGGFSFYWLCAKMTSSRKTIITETIC